MAAATRWAAAATLSTGLVVLVGAAAAGERRRAYEAAVLKTIGADRRTILASFALRAALVGAAAGVVAVVAGGLAGWVVTRFVMEGDYRFALGNALAIVAGGAAGEPARRSRLRAGPAGGAAGHRASGARGHNIERCVFGHRRLIRRKWIGIRD